MLTHTAGSAKLEGALLVCNPRNWLPDPNPSSSTPLRWKPRWGHNAKVNELHSFLLLL